MGLNGYIGMKHWFKDDMLGYRASYVLFFEDLVLNLIKTYFHKNNTLLSFET